ncbi:MAG: hypothetical protein JXJ17_10505 [Anaerolineae bacterium]|nr:hypothetical protein [Anaerolineae bacterium]
MLKISCFNCQWSWSLNQEATQAALDSLGEGENYYATECPKCRRLNKIPIKQLKRALPRARDKK